MTHDNAGLRVRDRREAAAWAAGLLSHPLGRVLILDTETTGLDGYLAELALIDIRGRVVFGARLDPGIPCEETAARIHRLDDGALAGMPSFTDIAGPLAMTLAASTVIAYNAAFEIGILRNELARMNACSELDSDVRAMLNTARWECAMLRYAAYVGDWNDYHGDYRWQKLPGGDHTALGDARATLDVVGQMAGGEGVDGQ